MSLASRKLIQATAGATTVDTGDDDFANVVLLLDGDGTSGDANNTFTDSSTNGFTVTENGDVVQGSFSPYGDNWSNSFDGNSDYISIADSTDFDFSAGDFTIECWASTSSFASAYNVLISQWNGSSQAWIFRITSSLVGLYANISGTQTYTASATNNLNEWNHFAVAREGSSLRFFKDGTLLGTSSISGTIANATSNVTVGILSDLNSVTAHDGSISNLRVVKGTAIYTSSFTPSTTPLTNVTNTVLLACQSNRFIDNSSSSHTLTPAGTASVTPFSPFKNDDARDITTDGGSGYFDVASTAYLSFSGGASTISDMTISGWVYPETMAPQAGNAYPRVFAAGGFLIYVRDDDIRIYNGAEKVQAPINNNEWTYFAAQRSSNTWTLYINGVSKGTASDSTNIALNSTNYIGSNGASNYFTGYIADLRITTSGSTSTAVPTSPVSDTLSGSAYSISNLSYENKSFSVSSQESNPQGVRFKSDGTKMFVVGNSGDDVNEYDLSTAWDVSTATYSQNFSVRIQDNIPTGVDFSPDGTKMYISGNSNRKLFQYTLSTAWDLSTASYASKSLSSYSNSVGDVFIRPDGTSIYEVNNVADVVNQYDMTTAFDLSTASYTAQISVSSQETIPTALTFSADGTKMLVAGQTGDDINQYTLSTAWSVATATFDNNPFSTTSQAGNPAGITFKDDGTKLYMISNASDAVYQYSVFGGAIVLLNFQDAGIYDRSGINNLDTVGQAQIDTAVVKYGTGSMEFDGSGDYLSMPVEPRFDFGTANFTIESWVNLSATGQFNPIVLFGRDSHSGITCDISSSNNPRIIADIGGSWGVVATGSTSFTTGQWYHLAFVRNGSSFKIYVDGVEDASATDSGSITAATSDSSSVAQIGYLRTNGGSDRYFDGYLDDVRVTKGIARYTADFTPPDAALPKF